jgi:hypothetical protein
MDTTNKAKVTADCLSHDVYHCDHRRHVEVKPESLLATVDLDTLVNFRSCVVSKEI